MVKRILGLLFVMAGGLLIADQLNIYSFSNVLDILWPSALILIGIFSMIELRRVNLFHAILVSVGIVFLLINLGYLDQNQVIPLLLPAIIILLGISMLVSPKASKRIVVVSSSQNNYSAIFGEVKEKTVNKEFTSCDINAVFGNAEIDFSEIELKGDQGIINVTAVLGGVELRLPTHYQIVIQGSPALGGFENKLRHQTPGDKKLIIQYTAVLGGVEIFD